MLPVSANCSLHMPLAGICIQEVKSHVTVIKDRIQVSGKYPFLR